jgi:hypothetical protein
VPGSVFEVAVWEVAAPRAGSRWYTLMRRSPTDEVSGSLRLAFEWDVTARGLLTLKLHALERVLQQRVEILCMLRPVPLAVAETWEVATANTRRWRRVGLPIIGIGS